MEIDISGLFVQEFSAENRRFFLDEIGEHRSVQDFRRKIVPESRFLFRDRGDSEISSISIRKVFPCKMRRLYKRSFLLMENASFLRSTSSALLSIDLVLKLPPLISSSSQVKPVLSRVKLTLVGLAVSLIVCASLFFILESPKHLN